MRKQIFCGGVFFLLLFFLFGCGQPEAIYTEQVDSYSNIAIENKNDGEENQFTREDENQTTEESEVSDQIADRSEDIYVHICGAVVQPGVYQLTADSRVFQIISMAGGFTEDAAEESVNQAGLLQDGQMIRIYTKEEYETMQLEGKITSITDLSEVGSSSNESAALVGGGNAGEADAISENGLVNLNTAAESELMSLPGIGESKAAAIVNYRDKNGGFTTIEDIMKVEGIKEGVFQKIKDLIRV